MNVIPSKETGTLGTRAENWISVRVRMHFLAQSDLEVGPEGG